LSDLEEEWNSVLNEARRRAAMQGRSDVVEYLALREKNDLARRTAIQWLFEVFTEQVAIANRGGASVEIARNDQHSFKLGNSVMVGTILTFRSGIRALSIEAGWPRGPKDGIVKGGGLAQAQIRHFGRKAHDAELLLLKSPDGAPRWQVIEKSGLRVAFAENAVRGHLGAFLG
jgi:hypothetical protein